MRSIFADLDAKDDSPPRKSQAGREAREDAKRRARVELDEDDRPKKKGGKSTALDKVARAAKKLKEKEKGGGTSYPRISWKDGDKHLVYIYQTWREDPNELFFKESDVHFGLGSAGKTARNCAGEKCPVCKHVKRVMDKIMQEFMADTNGNRKKAYKLASKTKEWKAVKRIKARTRFVMNVMPLKKKGDDYVPAADRPQLAEVGSTVIQPILRRFQQDEWGCFYDADTRYCFWIEREGADFNDTKYYVDPSRKGADSNVEDFDDQLHDLDALYTPSDPEELQRLLDGEDEDEDEDDRPRRGRDDDRGSNSRRSGGNPKPRRRDSEDEEDEDDRPRSRRDRDEDDDDSRSSRRRDRDEDEEDEDDRPRRRSKKTDLERELEDAA